LEKRLELINPAADESVDRPRITVVAISIAFGEFWADLAGDLQIAIDILTAAPVLAIPPGTVAVVIAAGGAERDAMQWLEGHASPPGVPVMVVGTERGRRTAMQIVARGASDYFAFPDDVEIFRNAVATAVKGSHGHAATPAAAGDVFRGIVGESLAVKRVLSQARRMLPHGNARVLILGETGTGKELLARAIHAGGPRHDAPFVAVNCSAFPEHLIESELFGHERGAFTDAHSAKPGLFEVADRGTLFLDEIGDLPLGLQAKLLRVLEDGQVRRVGGTKPRTVDVRVLAATNDRLPERVRAGQFREDLYFRLSTLVLTLPPLRERGDDVLLIARAMLDELAREHGLRIPPLSEGVSRALRGHGWPGNIRELKNVLERAMLLSSPGTLAASEVLPALDHAPAADRAIPFPATLRDIIAAAARETIKLCDGNRSEAARRLAISPRRLRRMLTGADQLTH
jgi:DNA-binding NtrC family response regulator